MPKIIRILRSCSMKIFSKFPTVNISKLHFWLVICIAKNFIWTTLKMIFSIFWFFCTLRFQIFAKYYPNKPHINGNIIYSAFRTCINLKTLMTGFVLQGHIWKMSSGVWVVFGLSGVCVQCSSSCEGGVQRRVVVCQDTDGRSTDHCDERVKPDESKSCDSGPCPHWNYSIWGQVRLNTCTFREWSFKGGIIEC